jgi:hypothetical protein
MYGRGIFIKNVLYKSYGWKYYKSPAPKINEHNNQVPSDFLTPPSAAAISMSFKIKSGIWKMRLP